MNRRLRLSRLRSLPFTFLQPLTRKPSQVGAPVSDLFLWRSSSNWETFFELTSLPSFFLSDPHESTTADLILFDNQGSIITHKHFVIEPLARHTISISSLLPYPSESYGTFCVFHSPTPASVLQHGSHLAERGYVSYRYNSAPIRSYVHGNLDAVALLPNQQLQMLGGSTILRRTFSLQHFFDDSDSYQLSFVNPTSFNQRHTICYTSPQGKPLRTTNFNLPSRGSCILNLYSEHPRQSIEILSHQAMARPIVFRIHNDSLDAFHG